MAFGGVAEVGGGLDHPSEQLPRPGKVPAPLVKGSQGVPQTQVVLSRIAHLHGALLEQANGFGHLAAVGQRPGRHDPAFDHDGRRCPVPTQLVPEPLDLVEVTQGPVAVGQDRVLLDGPAESFSRLQLGDRRPPLPHAVQGQAVELPDGGHVRGAPGEALEQSSGVGVALALVGPSGILQPLGVALGGGRSDAGSQLLVDVRRKRDGATPGVVARTLPGARGVGLVHPPGMSPLFLR